MTTVNIAELKNRLSAYLQRVRAGEEIVIRDRNLPVAKLVPFPEGDFSAEELESAAAGRLRLPAGKFDEAAFWKMGEELATSDTSLGGPLREAVSQNRQEEDDRLLGR